MMGDSERMACPLGRYRALDLTDEKGYLCGKILADLGMDVVKVERPGGDPGRNLGPFYHDIADPQKSLLWFGLNTGKRGITLNLATSDGREIFLTLVRKVDFVIESFRPGFLGGLGLAYEDLCKVNPGIIMASISGFGQTGPYAQWKAPDIVCMAISGYMNLIGDPDRPPVRITVPQAYLHAASEAAVGCLVALWHKEMTGEGQYVDVSAQECVAWDEFHNQNFWDMRKINLRRLGTLRMYGSVTYPLMYPCKDGYVIMAMWGGPIAARQRALVEWMEEEGFDDGYLRDFDWETFSPLTMTSETARELKTRFERFFLTKTRRELFDQAISRGFLIGPVNSIGDIFEDPHLRGRRFWQFIDHPELGDRIPYPGAPYLAAEAPYQIRRRAPLIGEHNDEVFRRELGLSNDQIRALKSAGVI